MEFEIFCLETLQAKDFEDEMNFELNNITTIPKICSLRMTNFD